MSVQRTLAIFLLLLIACDCSKAYQTKDREKQASQPGQQQQSPIKANPQEKQRDPDTPSQTKGDEAKRQEERPLETLLFINNVRSAPPEFAADLLIRIAQSDKVANKVWKGELIEEAFRLASTTQQPVKRVLLPLTPIDTRAGFLAYAFELNLDALSLQCRAVNAMLQIDKDKAKELFGEIPRLQLQALSCEDTLVYEVGDYYATLKKIAETAFSQKDMKLGEHTRLIESYISHVSSPVEIKPVLELIASARLSRAQRESLVYAVSKMLSSISGDDRSFTGSLYYVDQEIKKLISQCLQDGISAGELLRAYRAYLVRHFSGARCADYSRALSKRAQMKVIDDFNGDLRLKGDKNIAEITADDVKPGKLEGVAKEQLHWRSPKASVLMTKIKALRFGSKNTPIPVAERETLDWEARVDDFLKDMDDWKKDDEKSEEDYFHQKCVLFKGLIVLIPKKPLRESVISSFVEFLNNFDLNRGSRIEWFWQARFLLTDTPYYGGNDAAPSYVVKQSDMRPIVETTKNPILYLYVQTDRFLSGTKSVQ